MGHKNQGQANTINSGQLKFSPGQSLRSYGTELQLYGTKLQYFQGDSLGFLDNSYENFLMGTGSIF